MNQEYHQYKDADNKMKYFLDTEFIERPNTIELISIGIVCEDGREYYAISSEYNYHNSSQWVKNNVILPSYIETVHGDNRNMYGIHNFHYHYGKTIQSIDEDILEFVGDDPEFWGYYCDYDWVVFCWIFGTMMELPITYPMYCRDLKQSLDESHKGNFPGPHGEHNALVDARWNKDLYNYIYGNL